MEIRMQPEDVLQDKADSLERLMVSTLNTIMRRVAASVGYNITAAAVNPADEPLRRGETQWMEAVGAGFFPRVVEAFHASAEHIYGQVLEGYDGPDENVPFVSNEYAISYLTDSANRMVNSTEGTWARARGQLIEGFSAGESIEELSSRLMEISDWSEHRAARVARTEIISASNAGALAEMQSFHPDASKVWLATMDDRTREAHREADGETVLLDGTFTVDGEELSFPGDPSGSPGNIISCRCTLLFNLPREMLQSAIDDIAELPDVSDEFDPEDFVDWDTLTASVERRRTFEERRVRRARNGRFTGKGKKALTGGKRIPASQVKTPRVASHPEPETAVSDTDEMSQESPIEEFDGDTVDMETLPIPSAPENQP